MKLKLELQDGATILCVSEDLTAQHAAVLKAGLSKLLLSGKKSIVLDLTGVTDADPTVLKEVAALQQIVATTDSRLVVASRIAGVGDVSSREEALKRLSSPTAKLAENEEKLQVRIIELDAQRTRLLKTLNGGRSETEIKAMRRANSDLKVMIRELETQISQILSKRVEPRNPETFKARAVTVRNTLIAVLEQEGILPVK